MAIAVVPRIASTTYPVKKLFSDLVEALPFCLKKNNKAFQRVYVNKLDEQGAVRTLQIINLQTGRKTLGTDLNYIEDIHNGDLYLDEPASVIATKCAAVCISIPFYTIGAMAWNIYQLLRSVAIIAKRVFQGTRELMSLQRYFEATNVLSKEMGVLPSVVKERFWGVITAPLFGLGIEIAGLLGVIRPLHGRKCVALLEKAWHHGVSYRLDMRNLPVKPGQTDWADEVARFHSGRELYLAHCFQVRGNILTNPRLRVLRHKKD